MLRNLSCTTLKAKYGPPQFWTRVSMLFSWDVCMSPIGQIPKSLFWTNCDMKAGANLALDLALFVEFGCAQNWHVWTIRICCQKLPPAFPKSVPVWCMPRKMLQELLLLVLRNAPDWIASRKQRNVGCRVIVTAEFCRLNPRSIC
eukprot:Gregarina_sp_Poly_1__9018@NODE_54_length_17501_cov_44_565045_g46_i0_p6_GENE_NODE_54_length_17501_cov_44_565045_g46_i0NODE_54_length_17501_cov_44_565045_g46_i0_p6_ORF_typecomplete_len145_score1_38DUF2398/PF09661_10/0_24_NODE_54_length_17501_cov_44_565045_g46_i080418475